MTPYIDRTLLKTALNITTTDTSRDVLLDQAIGAACAMIDRQCGRNFGKTTGTQVRKFEIRNRLVMDRDGYRLLVDDIADETGLVVTIDGATIGGVETRPVNAVSKGSPVTTIYLPWGTWASARLATVTAVWGWPAVPPEVVQAALLQAARLYRRKDSPEGVAGSAEWGLVRVPYLDPDVRRLLDPYRIPAVA